MKTWSLWILIFVVSAVASWVAGSVAAICTNEGKTRYTTQQVMGIITYSKVAINGSEKQPGWNVSVWFDERPHWDLTVWFSYEVNGRIYSGKQQWYTDSNYIKNAHMERLNYLPGKKQSVYYDPSYPTRSLIEPTKLSMKESDAEFIASGVGGLLGGTGLLVIAWRRRW